MRPLVVWLLGSVVAGIAGPGAEAQPQWTVLAHIDTRGGLAPAAEQYEQRLREACGRRGFPLAVQRVSAAEGAGGGVVGTMRVWRDGAAHAGSVVQAANLAGAIEQAAPPVVQSLPARHLLLVVVGHGTGLLQARERGQDARELACALAAVAQAWGRPLDVLGLDTCFGASLEDLWELRHTAGTITAAPGLIYSPGLRWDRALEAPGADDPRALARAVTQAGMTGATAEEALVSVDTAGLPEVMAAVRELTGALDGQVSRQGPAVTLVRSRTRSWGQRRELCDLAGFAAGVEHNLSGEQVQAAAQRVGRAVGESLIARWWGGGAPTDGAAGLGVYFPPTFEAIPASYGELEFARDSGWYGFVRHYWEWVSSPMIEATNPPH
jgi:hypothetical protein